MFRSGCDVSRCSIEVVMSPGILGVLYCVLMRLLCLQVFWRFYTVFRSGCDASRCSDEVVLSPGVLLRL